MIAIVSLFLIVGFSLLVTRIAAVALVHTGMGREAARFQARSAFSGVGFTTSEAERVVNHPVRRRIILNLMLIGNVGIVTALASLLLSFLGVSMGNTHPVSLGVLGLGVVVLWLLAVSDTVDRHLCAVISWALRRWTDIDARDYARLLHLRDDYGVTELRIGEEDWLADRKLVDTGLGSEGVLVLGIECAGHKYIGAPGGQTEIRAGDTLILYGRVAQVRELAERHSGDGGETAHREAVEDHRELSLEEHERAGR